MAKERKYIVPRFLALISKCIKLELEKKGL